MTSSVRNKTQENMIMRELTEIEVSEVSGGLIPLVFGLIALNLAADGILLGYVAYAANNYYNSK